MLDVKAVRKLTDLIRERLLGGSKEDKGIRAELYNLNVYGREYSAPFDSDLDDRYFEQAKGPFSRRMWIRPAVKTCSDLWLSSFQRHMKADPF